MDSYGNFKRGDQRCSCRCHWDWSELNECFTGSRISLSDIDCLFVVERGGQIIFIETKNPGETLSIGQRIMLEELSKKQGINSLVIWGKRNCP